jgi:ketosteroid isomerase-like protein
MEITMKTLAALCVLGACLVLPVGRVKTTPKPEIQSCGSRTDDQAIQTISEAWKERYNRGDAAQVASLYSEDAYYLTQHFVSGVVYPREQIQAYVQRGVDAHYRVDSIDVLHSYCSGDFAYTITRYRSTNGRQKAMGVNLVVLRRIAGKWVIVAHESAVPDPATSIQSLTPTKH